MVAGAKNPAASPEPLYRALLDARLLIPQNERISDRYWDGNKVLEGAQIKLLARDVNGQRATPCYTDLDTLNRHEKGSPYWISMATLEFCKAVLACQLDAIFVHSPNNSYLMSKSDIQALAEGLVPKGNHTLEVARETPILIGMPATRPPEDVLSEMRMAAAGAGISEVYWFWLSIGGGPPHLGIGIGEPIGESVHKLGESIQRIWSVYLPSNPEITIMETDDTIRSRGEILFRAEN